MQEALEVFIKARLLTINQIDSNATIEVSHEALIREWKRLTEWLQEARDDIRIQQKLSEDVGEWEQHQRPNDRLYQGTRVKEAWVWAKRNMVSRQEQTFLKASVARSRRSLLAVIAVIFLLFTSFGAAGWFFANRAPTPDYVTTTDEYAVGSLHWAIGTARPGDTITFAPDIRGQEIVLRNVDIHIFQQNLTIQGPETDFIVIREIEASFVVDAHANANISNITFHGNRTNNQQLSLIQNVGKLTLKHCIISGNTAYSDSDANGGGIYNSGTLTVTNSTIANNTAYGGSDANGGGIYNSGTFTATNSTIANNEVYTNGGDTPGFGASGGGIYSTRLDTAVSHIALTFCTVVNNESSYDGPNDLSSPGFSEIHMKASILDKHNIDSSFPILSEGYNVILQPISSIKLVRTDRSINDLTSIFGSSPILRNDGGSTEIYQLITGRENPVINSIPQVDCTDAVSHRIFVDQRGMPRPGKNKRFCDSGAYESQD